LPSSLVRPLDFLTAGYPAMRMLEPPYHSRHVACSYDQGRACVQSNEDLWRQPTNRNDKHGNTDVETQIGDLLLLITLVLWKSMTFN